MNWLKKILGGSIDNEDRKLEEAFNAKDLKRKIVDAISIFLKEHKFKRSGLTFSLTRNDLIYYIQIQSSPASTATVYILTVNTGIVSTQLCELIGIDKPGYLDSHWRKRIGFYLDQPTDKWWTIDNVVNAEVASNEISFLLEKRVLPNLFTYASTKDLENFWLDGNCEGLTLMQRTDYLKLLGH